MQILLKTGAILRGDQVLWSDPETCKSLPTIYLPQAFSLAAAGTQAAS
jgi:hypothetical protein